LSVAPLVSKASNHTNHAHEHGSLKTRVSPRTGRSTDEREAGGIP